MFPFYFFGEMEGGGVGGGGADVYEKAYFRNFTVSF